MLNRSYVLHTIIVVFAIYSYYGMANADPTCDIVLRSGAFNTSDYAQSSALWLKKRDDICKAEYNSEAEAISAANQIGASIGYGPARLGASVARKTSNNKWSIADSKYCTESTNEIDSTTSTRIKQQITDVALKTWKECIEITQTNKLFVTYKPKNDGTGITGRIERYVRSGGFGSVTGIISSDPSVTVECQIGTSLIKAGTSQNIRIDRSPISISCKKDQYASIRIALTTDQGDQEWIDLLSVNEQNVKTFEDVNETINALRRQIYDLNLNIVAVENRVSKLQINIADSDCIELEPKDVDKNYSDPPVNQRKDLWSWSCPNNKIVVRLREWHLDTAKYIDRVKCCQLSISK